MKYYVVATSRHRALDLWTKIKSGRVSTSLIFSSVQTADSRKSKLATKYPKEKFRIYEFLES